MEECHIFLATALDALMEKKNPKQHNNLLRSLCYAVHIDYNGVGLLEHLFHILQMTKPF